MLENTWLVVLGVVLIIFELLFGAITGFDIAFVGLSLVIGGVAHYLSTSWQLGIIITLVVTLIYFVYFRKNLRKKLLLTTQRLGIDTLLGKIGTIINLTSKTKVGKVLVEGEVWQAKSQETLRENQEVMVISLDKNQTLEVTKNRLG